MTRKQAIFVLIVFVAFSTLAFAHFSGTQAALWWCIGITGSAASKLLI